MGVMGVCEEGLRYEWRCLSRNGFGSSHVYLSFDPDTGSQRIDMSRGRMTTPDGSTPAYRHMYGIVFFQRIIQNNNINGID